MTTIAYKDGVLAGDSRMTQGNYVGAPSVTKLFRSDDGRLLAMTGDAGTAMSLVRWLLLPERDRTGCKQPEIDADTRVIEVYRRDRIRLYEGKGFFEVRASMAAWGSGMASALGAMHFGASAMSAVRVASRIDPYTGGKIRSIKL